MQMPSCSGQECIYYIQIQVLLATLLVFLLLQASIAVFAIIIPAYSRTNGVAAFLVNRQALCNTKLFSKLYASLTSGTHTLWLQGERVRRLVGLVFLHCDAYGSRLLNNIRFNFTRIKIYNIQNKGAYLVHC